MPTTESPCPPCKALINDGLVASIAPLLNTPQSRGLAQAAIAYRDALSWLNVTVKDSDVQSHFVGQGCEQAQKLYDWATGHGEPDTDLICLWTLEIQERTRALLRGELPDLTR